MQTVWNFNYANYVQNISLFPGKYKLECWGACGGAVDTSDWTDCAKGGYSKGEIVFKKRTNLQICVGQSGYEKVSEGSSLTRSGFNGAGAAGKVTTGSFAYSKYGGGATDIRLYHPSATWGNTESLLSRILVAGGGGGMKNNFASARFIGHGGGYVGTNGIGRDRDFCGGGSQYQGGTSYDTEEYHGSLGKGGYGGIGVGGGGGWHGGAGSYSNECGGGGSGYALTKDSYKPPGYIPTSEYYLENIVMTTGGNTTKADGYAKITLLQALPFLTVSSYNSTQATFKADHTDPTLLTKIEVFIDDTLKETITTDLTLEKTINYTLEDNALHTLKIVVTDSANATAEKVVSISKNIMPVGDDASLQDIATKVSEMKDGLINGKTSIINVLALKNIESSLNNTLVEFSEKVKTSFDSSDASAQELQNQLTENNNNITQLNNTINSLRNQLKDRYQVHIKAYEGGGMESEPHYYNYSSTFRYYDRNGKFHEDGKQRYWIKHICPNGCKFFIALHYNKTISLTSPDNIYIYNADSGDIYVSNDNQFPIRIQIYGNVTSNSFPISTFDANYIGTSEWWKGNYTVFYYFYK